MLIKFWEGIGTQLAERWVATAVTPAFAFWGYGLLTWVWHQGWADALMQIDQIDEAYWWPILISGLLLVLLSSLSVQSLVLPVLRIIEGYLPRWLVWLTWPRTRLIQGKQRQLAQWQKQYDALVVRDLKQPLSRPQREQRQWLDTQLRQTPSRSDDVMPTHLGNLLRAAEQRPQDKYGLDAIICWSRLWLLLPETARQELSAARSQLDLAIRVLIWGGLLVVWTGWAWWSVLVAVVTIGGAYQRACAAAQVYGDLLEAAFDLYRLRLYAAVGLPKPTNPATEKKHGMQLTRYFYRGLMDNPAVPFVHEPPDEG